MNNDDKWSICTGNTSVFYVVKADNRQVSQLFEHKHVAESVKANLDPRLFDGKNVRVAAVNQLGQEVLLG